MICAYKYEKAWIVFTLIMEAVTGRRFCAWLNFLFGSFHFSMFFFNSRVFLTQEGRTKLLLTFWSCCHAILPGNISSPKLIKFLIQTWAIASALKLSIEPDKATKTSRIFGLVISVAFKPCKHKWVPYDAHILEFNPGYLKFQA